jgi:phospholipase D-like protein
MILDEIYEKLGGDTGTYRGESYDLTENNSYSLLSTPNLWDHDPAKMDYVPAGKNLTDGIKQLIGEAKYTVDISTMLGSPLAKEDQPVFPDGPFQAALSDGINHAATQGTAFIVRILFGIQPSTFWSEPINLPQLLEWVASLKIPASIACYAAVTYTKKLISFNHAKLVVVDGEKSITGGHNMWNGSYCKIAPVHDVSVRVNGPANMVAQRFLNLQWNMIAKVSRQQIGPESTLFIGGKTYRNALLRIERKPADTKPGNARVLAVGRLGKGLIESGEDATASRIARIEAANGAKKSVKLSQQMLAGRIIGLRIPYDQDYIDALATAVAKRNVDVYVVVSDSGTKLGYGGDTIAETAKQFYETIGKISKLSGQKLADLCALKVHIAVLRFVEKKPGNNDPDIYWKWLLADLKTRQSPANHAKVWIVDDEIFYVGSDNAYTSAFSVIPNPEGFQEFGYIISGAVEVQDFLDNYWNKLWKYSGPYQFSDWQKFKVVNLTEGSETAEEDAMNATGSGMTVGLPVAGGEEETVQ